MENTVKSGLSGYAYFSAYLSIIIGVCIMISAIFLAYNIISKNYKKAMNVSVNVLNNLTKSSCSPTDLQNKLCSPYVTYTTDSGNYTEPEPIINSQQIAPDTLYYEEKNPSKFTTGMNPIYLPSFICCFAIVILIIGIGQIMFFKSNKDAAAVIGGIELTQNLLGRNRY